MAHPHDRKYTETHEWVKVEAGKEKSETVGIIGITAYAVNQLSDLVHLELPKVGDSAEVGQAFGEVESVKTVAELVSPISGTIVEINSEAVKDVEVVMKEPFEDGWLIKVKLADRAEVDALMTHKEYADYIKASKSEEKEKKGEEEIDEGFFM